MTIEHRVRCDECGEYAPIDKPESKPFDWIRLITSTVLPPTNMDMGDSSHDFCSVGCMTTWLTRAVDEQAKAENSSSRQDYLAFSRSQLVSANVP